MEAQYLYEIVALVLLVAAALVFFILPDRHERNSLKKKVDALAPGDRVTLKNGLDAVVESVGDGSAIVTTGPDGVRLEAALWGIESVEAAAGEREGSRSGLSRVAGRTAERAR